MARAKAVKAPRYVTKQGTSGATYPTSSSASLTTTKTSSYAALFNYELPSNPADRTKIEHSVLAAEPCRHRCPVSLWPPRKSQPQVSSNALTNDRCCRCGEVRDFETRLLPGNMLSLTCLPSSPLKPEELQVLRAQYEKEGDYVGIQTKFNYAWVWRVPA